VTVLLFDERESAARADWHDCGRLALVCRAVGRLIVEASFPWPATVSSVGGSAP
jgi:hypothetical protein